MNKSLNVLKEKLKNGEKVFGTWNSISSPSLIEIIGQSGMDFVVIDTEHGPLNMESVQDLIRSSENVGMSPLVRVSSNDPSLILRTLDVGAHGVQVPHVSNKEGAEEVVKAAKYYPLGERGYSPFTRAGQYGKNAANHAQDSNENTIVVVNVEGVEGINNLAEISSVKGIDVVFIGPYDLSQSLGKPGQVKDENVIDLLKKSVEIIRGNGLVCGSFACDIEYLDILNKCGVQYLTYMVDAVVISNSYSKMVNRFKEKCN